MEYNLNIPFYYSYKEFENNYIEDLNEWFSFYPDSKEEYYLDELKKIYKNLDDFNNYPKVEVLKKDKNRPDGYSLDTLHIKSFADILEKRLSHKILYNYPNNKNDIYFATCVLESFEICGEYLTDSYDIDYNIFRSFLPFFEVKYIQNIEYEWYVYFNEYKYQNFEYTIKRIFEFIDDKKQELNNLPINTKQTNKPNETKKLNWQGTSLELTELIKALISSGKLNPELTEKEIFSRVKEFLSVDDFNHNDKAKDIRKRTKDLTPLISQLETALTNWIKAKDL